MLEIAEELDRWVQRGRDFAVATLVAVQGSAPHPPGAALAVDADGTAIGSVSGGCVEGAVYELCRQALADGETVLKRFGYSDEDAFEAGLTCGGVVDIVVTPVRSGDPVRAPAASALAAAARGEAVALARIVSGPARLTGGAMLIRPDGSTEGGFDGPSGLDRTVVDEAAAFLRAGHTGTREIVASGSRPGTPVTLLVEAVAPPPRMIVFGAIDFASALVRIGRFLGFHVTLCDARPVFATRARFPEADEIVVEWPHAYLARTEVDARTVLCVLTHDAKFDIPLLELALRLPVAYVGAMGSHRTHFDRRRRLLEAGVTHSELARLRSPIGLDLGARTAEETALSIASEIIAERRGGSGAPLVGARLPIHHDGDDAARQGPSAVHGEA
ncbi:XdhC/CoxI family protein [Streptomyces sp. TP-A0875]|uniref:XdhC family protein n=1 Tax=Streptomyces sp. TP-A0875 TaxID=552354 RepID=UPI0006B6496B|nr:XdhC/CoxI family protein [Streptomyces sp. TP-A0875]